MIDAIKDYLAPKRFGLLSYVCLIVHCFCGLILIPVTTALRASETGKFSCAVDKKSTAVYRTYVEKACHSRYEQTYNSPLPLYGFVFLSFGLQVLVSLIYSLSVSRRVEKIAERISNASDRPRSDSEQTIRGFFVFWFYFLHLVTRSVFGIVFTILQYTAFYPSGFDFEFSCSIPTTDATKATAYNGSTGQINVTTMCENSTALENEIWGVVVSILNTVCALVVVVEVFRLWPRFRCRNSWTSDTEFITEYLLCERPSTSGDELESFLKTSSSLSNPPVEVNAHPRNDVESTSVDGISSSLSNPPPDCNTQDNNFADCSLQTCIEFYKQKVLQQSLSPDVKYVSKVSLDDLYIDVVIHKGRAQHQFLKEMERHEIYDVYLKVPSQSICLDEIKDLFYPNIDTKGESPRTILAVGRPGIGKTVLTEKIIRDWANGVDEFYHGKIAFSFKFRWISFEELKATSLKTFLHYGAGGLDKEKFEIIFEQIFRQPKRGIFIFDGLDEFNGDFMKCLDESQILPNDHNTPMSPMTLFIKLVSGKMLRGATILVTSRPTIDEFYSKHYFDRTVEMLGFTSDKIEHYVGKFCENNNRSDLKSKIWNHIVSSSDLLNLCYIPVNSYIVCDTLSGCLSNSNNDTGALPTTMTALYQTAVDHFGRCHNRNLDKTSSEQMLVKLEKLAFDGMENGQLVFNEKQFNEQMKKSGLLNSFSNPNSSLQTQFCFIHLTLQEFLAAKYVIETFAPDKIEEFILTHFESGKWHLVLQFIAGLLAEKIQTSGGDYQDCVLAFAKSLSLPDGLIDHRHYGRVCLMKCLREVGDKEIVKNVFEKTDLSDAQTLKVLLTDSPPSDWAAMTFFCQHLNKLLHLDLELLVEFPENICLGEVCELLQQKCFETLILQILCPGDMIYPIDMKSLIEAMTNSKCTLNHEHAKLRHLEIHAGLKDAEVSNLCTFIKDGHASHLQVLGLQRFGVTLDGIRGLSEVLKTKLCGELKCLNFGFSVIDDEGLGILCNALIQGHCKINTLIFIKCSLTKDCVPSLSEVLCHEQCELTDLVLGVNDIRDEGVRTLCTEALGKEQCKLTRLYLGDCSLTAKCVPCLSSILCDKHCKLTDLTLDRNAIGDEGLRMLCTNALGKEQCKLTQLSLVQCGLTDQYVPLLCKTLQDRNCRLIFLSLRSNNFTEQRKSLLRDVQEVEICKARCLQISF